DIIALSHALGRVVGLPECAQQLWIRHLRGIIDNQHHLVVTGTCRTDFLIGWIRCMSCGIANRRDIHTRQLPEFAFRPPKAAETEQRRLEPSRKWRFYGVAVDIMPLRDL